MTDIEYIAQRLAARGGGDPPPEPDAREAAVAIILRANDRGAARTTDVLFIRRAEKAGDPWSGHMAFPGGHRDREDPTLLDASIRETHEEIGLALDLDTNYIGALAPHSVQPRMRPIGMHIAPFVFRVRDEIDFNLSHEVAEVVWTPLEPIMRGENHCEEDRIINGAPVAFGGYRINGGHFVWGLTYRILHAFFATLDSAWRPPITTALTGAPNPPSSPPRAG
jgi:8-oxo-dGTP pyrophosphatase MutT (NUDIX family)